MPSNIIQWFPGHMAKTRRLIEENLSAVDVIFELIDARIPKSSKNEDIARLIKDKPVVLILNKAEMADAAITESWVAYYKKQYANVLTVDCISGQGLNRIRPTVQTVLSEKLERLANKGMNKPMRAMVLGIPNVGKSSLINRLCGKRKAQVENRPGVTVRKQWVKTELGIELLDMPGVLWPKFDDRLIGENLAITGAIKDTVLQLQDIAYALCERLILWYPDRVSERFGLDIEDVSSATALELYEMIAKKRGMIMAGAEIDYERCAKMLLDEYRSCKIGRISLERP